jgi:hypothetical protein
MYWMNMWYSRYISKATAMIQLAAPGDTLLARGAHLQLLGQPANQQRGYITGLVLVGKF